MAVLSGDLDVLSCPLTHLELHVSSVDGRDHQVELLLEVDSTIATPDATAKLVWDRSQVSGWTSLRIGTQGPDFTRNLVIFTDSTGATGVGEVPGGEAIRRTLDDSRELVEGTQIAR